MKNFVLISYVLLGVISLNADLAVEDRKPDLVIEYHSEYKRGDLFEWSCPVFASYTDGSVIWRRNWNNSVEALATAKVSEMRNAIDALHRTVKENDGRLISLGESSDGPYTVIWSRGHTLSISGEWRQNVTDCGFEERERIGESALSKGVFELLRSFVAFDSPSGVPWRPERVIVTLFPAGPALGPPVPWPKSWPTDFSKTEISPRTLKRTFSGAMLPDLMAILSVGGQSRAVLFQEPKFAKIEIVFPGDVYWRTPSRLLKNAPF